MFGLSKLFRRLGLLLVAGGFAALLALSAAYLYLAPRLPAIESLKEIHLQVPLRVYTRDGRLVANFGEKRRVPVKMAEVPETMIRAVLASEDERFYEHPGVDWQGLTRAVLYLILEGKKGPGGSTITMQVARNFFLGREKTYLRKANEILLALKIERELGKDEILELYLNKIFLGHRAYGVGAAASVYYGVTLDRLTLAQIAMIAGLPKAPSRFNPIANPVRAVERRNYVLGQMRELGYLDGALYERATRAPVSAALHELPIEVEAPYLAEMIRADMDARYGDASTSAGYKVYASIDSKRQVYANEALRGALLAYDRRHGYRGPEFRVDMSQPRLDADAVLKDVPSIGTLVPALVTVVEGQTASVYTREHGVINLPWEGLSWARPYINENRRGAKPEQAADIVEPGDIVRVAPNHRGLGSRAATRRRGCAGGARPDGRLHRGHWRRLRFSAQQVQSCHTGPAPTRLEFQTLHLLGCARLWFDGGYPDKRCAGGFRRSGTGSCLASRKLQR